MGGPAGPDPPPCQRCSPRGPLRPAHTPGCRRGVAPAPAASLKDGLIPRSESMIARVGGPGGDLTPCHPVGPAALACVSPWVPVTWPGAPWRGSWGPGPRPALALPCDRDPQTRSSSSSDGGAAAMGSQDARLTWGPPSELSECDLYRGARASVQITESGRPPRHVAELGARRGCGCLREGPPFSGPGGGVVCEAVGPAPSTGTLSQCPRPGAVPQSHCGLELVTDLGVFCLHRVREVVGGHRSGWGAWRGGVRGEGSPPSLLMSPRGAPRGRSSV